VCGEWLGLVSLLGLRFLLEAEAADEAMGKGR